jgi:tripartite-type tricarboxylate transporter receptor subunit TctC
MFRGAGFFAGIVFTLSVPFSYAQPVANAGAAYPTKPIRIIIPFPAGDALDIMSRLISPALMQRLGQNIIVDNRPGAAGQLGLDLGAHAPPDGYTLIGGQGGNLVVQPHTYKKLPYNPLKDFVPVAVSTTNYMAIATNNNVPFKTLKEMVAYARANPGKLTIASNGEGGFPHMTMEMLRLAGGYSYLHVPYKGSVQIMTELLGNRIDATILGIAAIAPNARSGRIRLIGVTSPTRAEHFPDVPAAAEVLPGFDSRGWFGYVAPAGMPPKIVALLNQEIMSTPEVKQKMSDLGMAVVAESPEFFAKLLKSDYDKYGKLIKDIGFQPQ